MKRFFLLLMVPGILHAYPYDWAPGKARVGCTKETICAKGFTTKSIRPATSYTNKLKKDQIKKYDLNCDRGCEEDHVISLEICGEPKDPLNLSPEPYDATYGAHEKDKVENWLHEQVCKGKLTLQEAQYDITHDWISVYQSLHIKKEE